MCRAVHEGDELVHETGRAPDAVDALAPVGEAEDQLVVRRVHELGEKPLEQPSGIRPCERDIRKLVDPDVGTWLVGAALAATQRLYSVERVDCRH